MRTHLGLSKDAPLRQAIQRSGTVVATPILSGLQRRYAQICFREGQIANDGVLALHGC